MTQDLLNASSGSYSVTATDLNGCMDSASFIIQPKNPLRIFRQVKQETCAGANDGSIGLNIIGDYPPFYVIWSTGDSTSAIMNLQSGTYTATISDAAECDTVINVNVGVSPPISLSAVATSSTGSNGEIDLTISGGNPPYTINWSNGATVEDPESLAPGNYSVTVSNPGCSTDSLTVQVDSAFQITGKVRGINSFNDTFNVTSGIVVVFGLTDPLGGYDTVDVVQIGGSGIYRTGEILVDSVILLAVPNDILFPDLIPTYFGGNQLWTNAQTHYSSSPQPYDIVCPYNRSQQTGTSTINGQVLSNLGSGKRSDPIDNVGVSLGNQSIALLDYIKTDANGNFVLSNLEAGQYLLTIDYPGIPMMPLNTLDIVSDGETVTVEVSIDDDIVSFKVINTGIERDDILKAIEIYPSPSDGRFIMQLASTQAVQLIVSITNLYGKKVYQDKLEITSGLNTAQMNLSELPGSIYMLSLTTNDNRMQWLHKVVIH